MDATQTVLTDDAGDDVAYSLERRLERAQSIADPLGRMLTIDKILADVIAFKEKVSDQRAIAAFDANQDGGVGLNAIADALGRGKSLAQQLVRDGRKLVEEGDED